MRTDTQFSIFLINQPGVMAAVTKALADASVNLYALSLSDSGEHGVLRVVTTDAEKTRQVLRDTHDRWTETDVLVVPIGNQPGAFGQAAQKISDAGVNTLYAYCTANPDAELTTAIFKVANIDKAKAALS
jgi:hypothetical protein